jgi:hypothetical protein
MRMTLGIMLTCLAARGATAQGTPTAADKKQAEDKIAAAMVEQGTDVDSVSVPPPARESGRITTRYDRFRQRTVVIALPQKAGFFGPYLPVGITFGYPGKEMHQPPKSVLIAFRPKSSPSWRLLNDHDVIFLVDDTIPVSAGETIHEGSIGMDGGSLAVQEEVTAIFSLRDFMRLASAHTLEVRVGSDEALQRAKFKPEELDVFREVALMLLPAARAH